MKVLPLDAPAGHAPPDPEKVRQRIALVREQLERLGQDPLGAAGTTELVDEQIVHEADELIVHASMFSLLGSCSRSYSVRVHVHIRFVFTFIFGPCSRSYSVHYSLRERRTMNNELSAEPEHEHEQRSTNPEE